MSDVDFTYLWQPVTKISERIVVSFGLLSFYSLETVTAVQYCSPTLKELCSPGWSQTCGLPASKSCILGIGICHQGPDPFVYRTLLWSINWFRGKYAPFLILWTLYLRSFFFFQLSNCDFVFSKRSLSRTACFSFRSFFKCLKCLYSYTGVQGPNTSLNPSDIGNVSP